MSKKKLTAVVMAVVVFGWVALRPSRAEALDAWAWALIGVGSYIALLVTATLVAYPHPAPLVPGEDRLPQKPEDEQPLRFANGCKQDAPGVVVACW